MSVARPGLALARRQNRLSSVTTPLDRKVTAPDPSVDLTSAPLSASAATVM